VNAIKTNHPKSLRVFFATEMWERYGFYVVQTLLALYLTRHFNWNDKDIYALVGSFTALTYVSPVVGGWMADRVLGQKRTIVTGGIILLMCYFILGIVTTDHSFIMSLAGIAVGTGLFKPNISSLLGNEYPVNSPQREKGFTIFYMGITSGIILGCTIPSYLTNYFNWSGAFISATIGMFFGLVVFIWGIHHYQIQDYGTHKYQFKKVMQATLIVFLLWLVSFCILNYTILANFAFIAIVIVSIGYFLHSIKYGASTEVKQTKVVGLLCIISVIFWAFYFQMFLSFTLFLSRVVEPTLFGIQFPPPYYVSIQSFGAIIFGWCLSRRKLVTNKEQPGIQSANKFLFAIFFMTGAFALFTLVCHFSTTPALLSPLFFLPAYLLISLAELFLYPVGLSAVTVLSSRKKVSTVMGVFFVSLGVGGFLAGKLADIAAIPPGKISILALKYHYTSALSQISFLLVAALLVCAYLNYVIKRLLTEPAATNSSYLELIENQGGLN